MYTATGTRGLGGYELLPAQGKLIMAGMDRSSLPWREGVRGRGTFTIMWWGKSKHTPTPPSPFKGEGESKFAPLQGGG